MLTDNNPDLIACYRTVRDCPDQVIDELTRLARDHDRGGPDHYYGIRNNRFNPQRAALTAATNGEFSYSPALAAMFIYLNRTGYNGLFRLNADGEFNVPAGRYAKPRICDEPNIRRASRAFALPGMTLERARFDCVIDGARAGDFVYFDPPYAPLSKTARFTNYTAEGFDAGDQEQSAGRRHHAEQARLPCGDEQLDGAGDREALRHQRGAGVGTAMLSDSGAAGDQLERQRARRGG